MNKIITVIPFLLFALFSQAQINMVVKPDGFLFLDGKDSLCFYQKTLKSKDGAYSRCNYIHPLYGLSGSRITEDFPADHPHQRGVFWAWHQIFIEGKPVSDGWELNDFTQQIVDIEFRRVKENGVFTTVVDWKSPLWEKGERPYLREESKMTFHPKTANYRQIDFEISLKALTDHLTIGGSDDEKGYGGFSVRMVQPDDLVFSGAQGVVEPLNGAVEAGNFMNISGTFDQKGTSGLVIWNSPENPQPNSKWILRKKASMQNAAFPGQNPVLVPVGEPLVLRYSLLVYTGELSVRRIKKIMTSTKH